MNRDGIIAPLLNGYVAGGGSSADFASAVNLDTNRYQSLHSNNNSASSIMRASPFNDLFNWMVPADDFFPSDMSGSSSVDDAAMNYWDGLFASVGEQNELNRLYNAEQAQLNRDFNASEAEKSRQWSERMSNTSYQRAVEDLQKAGLNPILAYQQGGSSTPSPSSASGQAASYNVGGGDSFSDILNSFANLISSASDLIGTFTPSKIIKKVLK